MLHSEKRKFWENMYQNVYQFDSPKHYIFGKIYIYIYTEISRNIAPNWK